MQANNSDMTVRADSGSERQSTSTDQISVCRVGTSRHFCPGTSFLGLYDDDRLLFTLVLDVPYA